MDVTALNAARSYTAGMGAAAPAPDPEAAAALPLRDFASTLAAAERTAQSALAGSADPHALVTALAQSELAVEAAVTVRNKVVEAYQEILRMPV